MKEFLDDFLMNYLTEMAVTLTTIVVVHYVSKHSGFGRKLRNWRYWARGADSWAPCVIIPIMLTILAYVAMTGFYWGVYVAAFILFVYTHFSLPGVVKLKMEPIVLPSVIVTARVRLVPAPNLAIHGIKIPNPKYLKYRWAKYRTRKNPDSKGPPPYHQTPQ